MRNENWVADALSRRVIVNHIATMSSYGTHLHGGQQDDKYQQLRHKLQQQGIGDQDVDYHLTTEGLVIFRDMIYVSNNNELKKLIMREFHINPYSGHLGYQKTLTTVKKFYYWLNLEKELAEFVIRCLDCQWVKENSKHLCGLFQPILTLEWKWEVISMDFITSLPRTSQQHDSIMIVVDRLTKVDHFITVKSMNSTSDIAKVFIRDIVRLHGISKKIVSDKDVKFTSIFWKELFTSLGTKLAFTTNYHL